MSSRTDNHFYQQPASNNSVAVDPPSVIRHKQEFIVYDNADPTNIPVPMGTDMTSVHSTYSQPGNSSMHNEYYRSMHQPSDAAQSMYHPSDATESVQSTINGRYDEEQLNLQSSQPQSTMASSRGEMVLASSEPFHKQPHDSLPNLSLPNDQQESLPSSTGHHSFMSQYSSHYHQSNPQNQSSKVVSRNHSAKLGEVNSNHYQHQVGMPMSNVGSSQFSSHDQGGKVIFPGHSVVLGEVNQNLPSYTQQQGNLPSTARGTTSIHQTTSMGQNIPLHNNNNRMGIKDESLMSTRNRKLDGQNPINNTIPPNLTPMGNSNISSFIMDKGEGQQQMQGNPHQFGAWNQPTAPPSQPVVPSQHHRPQNFVPNPQHSVPNQYHPQNRPPHISNDNRIQQPGGSGGGYTGKKVFILHFGETIGTANPVLNLGVTLRRLEVDVTLDLFEYDNPPDNWPLWYEQKIQESNVVLCIITENFYHQLTNGNHVRGYSVYNLMNSSNNIAFRAVFIDADKRDMMEYVPPAMRGATCYSISSNQMNPNNEEFANLYAFLTGQNRIKKPELGNMIILAPKKSRFGNFSGGPAPPPAPVNNSRHMQQQQRMYQQQPMLPQAPPPQAPPAADPSGRMPDVEQANFIFTLLGGDATPIKSVHSHNRMFMQIASKMMADWEALGRMLCISEPDIYAIKADNVHSVVEQAVQMFQQWLGKNGSRATLGVLTTAVYDSGPQYWNLLDVISKFAPQR